MTRSPCKCPSCNETCAPPPLPFSPSLPLPLPATTKPSWRSPSLSQKLKIKLGEINQNPFRYTLLDAPSQDGGTGAAAAAAAGVGEEEDIAEDMSWGFDQTFFGDEGGDGSGGEEDEDYDDI